MTVSSRIRLILIILAKISFEVWFATSFVECVLAISFMISLFIALEVAKRFLPIAEIPLAIPVSKRFLVIATGLLLLVAITHLGRTTFPSATEIRISLFLFPGTTATRHGG